MERTVDELLSMLFQAHPWHGVTPGEKAPEKVTAYIELVPTDGVKYELDKKSGHLRIDRPQRYSSLCPTLYGFVPQSFCGAEVAARCAERTLFKQVKGDGDPLDICVLAEKTVPTGNFLMSVRPIGGLRMVDGNEADDKIIAVLEADAAYGGFQELTDCPKPVIDRLEHYFLTYKQLPGHLPRKVEIAETYGREEAHEVIMRSVRDYHTEYGDPSHRLDMLRRLLAR